jgi:hypothetical protein
VQNHHHDSHKDSQTEEKRARLPLSARFLLFAISILVLNGYLLSHKTDKVIEQAFLAQADQKIHLLLDQIRRNVEQERIALTDVALAAEVDYLNRHSDFGWQLHIQDLYAFDARPSGAKRHFNQAPLIIGSFMTGSHHLENPENTTQTAASLRRIIYCR